MRSLAILRNAFAIAIVALSVSSVQAEDSFGLNRPALPPSSAENRIIKWCAAEGSHTRYASANIQLKGYTPCGEVKTAMSCDAVGTRTISPGGTVPYGNRDCSMGKRLVVIRHDEVSPTPDDRSFTTAEQHAMNREFKQLQRDQEKQEAKEIEAAMRGFAGLLFNDKALRQQSRASSRGSSKSNRSQQIDVAQLLKLLSQP